MQAKAILRKMIGPSPILILFKFCNYPMESVFQTPIKQASVDSVQINNSVKSINLKRVQFSYRHFYKKRCHFSAIDSVDLSSVIQL